MTQRKFILLLITFFSVAVVAQNNIGFEFTNNKDIRLFDEQNFDRIADSLKAIQKNVFVIGLKSEYRDYIDSADIKIQSKGLFKNYNKGIYILTDTNLLTQENIHFSIIHPEYYKLDTIIKKSQIKDNRLVLELKPKYKITIRGRVYSANTPLEGVDVLVIHKKDSFKLRTRECFYDSEEYWNCLYHGMFKQNIISENPNDSVKIILKRAGYKSNSYTIKISDYSGQILAFRMDFDEFLPEAYRNTLALKFTFPLLSNSNWYAGFSYLYSLNFNKFNRIALGVEGSILMKNYRDEFATFDGANDAVLDTTYLIGFLGPSVVVWITNPILRKYSLYGGCSYAYMFTNSSFNLQPFLGGRFFIDLNKAVSFDVRYISYDMDVVNYEFNQYGNALKSIVNESFEDLMISIGLQIGF